MMKIEKAMEALEEVRAARTEMDMEPEERRELRVEIDRMLDMLEKVQAKEK